MPVILIIERTGIIKETAVKTFEEDQLYKKAGFKTPNDFGKIAVFPHGTNNQIHVYGKTKGKAGQENKYDFPPPIDSALFFGNCLLVNKESDEIVGDLALTEWEKTYEKLFGGFEDISENSDDEEEEIDEEELRILADPTTKFTKEGYVKDDFIVDDEDEDEDEDDDEDEDEDEDEYDDDEDDDSIPVIKTKSKAKPKKTVVKKKEGKTKIVLTKIDEPDESDNFVVKKGRRTYTKSTVDRSAYELARKQNGMMPITNVEASTNECGVRSKACNNGVQASKACRGLGKARSPEENEKPKKNKKKSEKTTLFSSEESEKDARTDLLDELSEEEYFQ